MDLAPADLARIRELYSQGYYRRAYDVAAALGPMKSWTSTPARLIGAEIPLASRILAICSTYDTMTGEGRYRSPMTPEEAIDELRHAAANGQLDPELTESFIVMLEREGPTAFLSDERVDVDAELEFERRVREMAEPKTPAATALPR